MIFTFVLCLLGFVVIGLASSFKKEETREDYLLAGKGVAPWLIGLSAIATYCSGYMFIGQIGYTYLYGLSSIWVMAGFILGDLLISMLVHHRVRKAVSGSEDLTYMAAFEQLAQQTLPTYRKVGGLIITLLLCGYAAAQFAAGSKALHVLFGWNYATGAILGSMMVLAYCWAGGIRASIWTDAAQAVVMFSAMVVLCIKGINNLGGLEGFWHALHHITPTYMNWFRPATMAFTNSIGSGAPVLFILGWFFAGMGIIGQPQVMTRFMALKEDETNATSGKNMLIARAYYYVFYTLFYILTLLVAVVARLLLPNAGTFDAELALPMLAQQMLSPVWVGFILAGLFAATMSTADSQILCCTAAITEDVMPKKSTSYVMAKLVTVLVTALALGISLINNNSVFELVNLSAGTMASLFTPLLAVLCIKVSLNNKIDIPINEGLAVAMLIIAGIVHLSWRFSGLGVLSYELFPGILAGLITYAVGAWFIRSNKIAADHCQ